MFTLNREALGAELALLTAVAEKKGTIPILAFVKMEFDGSEMTLTATDLDVTLKTKLAAEGDAWNGCVPLRQLFSLVRLLDKPTESVNFDPKESRIQVKAGKSKLLLPFDPIDRFPQAESVPNESITIDGKAFLRGLELVIPAIDTGESRYTLRGVNMECRDGSLFLVTTDQHRLAVVEIPLESQAFKLLIPRAAVNALIKLDADDLNFAHDEQHAAFTAGNRTLITRLLIGQFPQWELVIPKTFRYSVDALTGDIESALKRAFISVERRRLSNGEQTEDALRLKFSKQTLSIETAETDAGQSEEVVEVNSTLNGESVLIGMNGRYLLDGLGCVGDQVQIALNDANSQIRLRPLNDEHVTHIIMPCRI